jgi:hypothetical protein
MAPSRLAPENYTFVIALFVIGSFVLYVGLILFYLRDLNLLEKMSAVFSGFVAAILGYFFGQRPVHALTNQVQDAIQQKEEIKKEKESVAAESEMDKATLRRIKEELSDLERRMNEI